MHPKATAMALHRVERAQPHEELLEACLKRADQGRGA